RARPEDAILALNFLVGNAVIVTQPAARHPPQLTKDVLDAGIGELLPGGKTPCQVADDLPVRTRLSRRLHRLPDADDAAFGSGHSAFVFLLQRARQDDIGVARRFGHKKVDDAEELEPLERGPRVLGVRQRHKGIETDAQESADLPTVDGLPHLYGGAAEARQDVFGNPPTFGNDTAVFRVVDVPSARQLVTALPVLPPTL